MLVKCKDFFCETLWRVNLTGRHAILRWIIQPLRFIVLTLRAYIHDGTNLHASALTYTTMLAIIPILALGLTSLKAFGAGDVARTKIIEKIDVFAETMKENADAREAEMTDDQIAAHHAKNATQAAFANELRNLADRVFRQIDSINFAKIGTVGAVALLIMVISVLGKVEFSFNMIWGITKARSLWRKFTDYLSIILIVPMLFIASTSLPILETICKINPHAARIANFINDMGILNALVPFLMGTCLVAFLFTFLPNTRVKFSSALIGGAISTVLLWLFFKLCILLQVGIANNSAIYGSLIALPILLFWIYSSWLIILFGAELCYVHQHRSELLRESAFSHPSERDTILLALALVVRTAECAKDEYSPMSAQRFATEFSLPLRDINRTAAILERNKILVEVSGEDEVTPCYVLCRNATYLTTADVINACLDDTPGEDLLHRPGVMHKSTLLPDVEAHFSKLFDQHFTHTIDSLIQQGPILKDIV